PKQQALIRLALVRFDRGVIEAKLGKVSEDDKEDLPGVPDVVLGLDNVPGVVERFDGGLGLDEEFGLAAETEAVIRTAFGVGFAFFDDDFPFVMRQPGFVFEVPAERLEERRDEVHARLRLRTVLREIVMLVGIELSDKLLETLGEDFG